MITTPQAFLVRRSVRLGARLGRRVVVGRLRGRLLPAPAPAPSPWRRRAPVLLALAGGTIVVLRVAQAQRSGGVAPATDPPAPPPTPAPAAAGVAPAPPVDDAALAASIRGVVASDDVEVHVDRGVVTLSGRVQGLARVAALVQQTERVAGVRAVRSELRDATPDTRS